MTTRLMKLMGISWILLDSTIILKMSVKIMGSLWLSMFLYKFWKLLVWKSTTTCCICSFFSSNRLTIFWCFLDISYIMSTSLYSSTHFSTASLWLVKFMQITKQGFWFRPNKLNFASWFVNWASKICLHPCSSCPRQFPFWLLCCLTTVLFTVKKL